MHLFLISKLALTTFPRKQNGSLFVTALFITEYRTTTKA
jgi:hypothetical protein